jgi:NAD(P)-dependent dehydrogenase (short-subunit alcohol dehydrogenase family)
VPATILVTRCTTKADLALAQELRRRGHVVYATAPRVATVGPLQAHDVRVDAVDLGNWETVKALMERLQRENAVVDLVLNHIDLGPAQAPLPGDALQHQFDVDMVAAFAILNLYGFSARHFKRVVNLIRAPDWSPLGIGSPYNPARKLLHKLCATQRETLAPFGVEVVALQASGAPTHPEPRRRKVNGTASEAELFLRQLADAVLLRAPPALNKIDGVGMLSALRRKPKLIQ